MEEQQEKGRSDSDKFLSEETLRLMDRVQLSEMMLDASIDQVIAIDADRKIIIWNRACEEFTGLKAENVLGLSLTEAIPEFGQWEAFIRAIDNALKGFKVFVKPDQGSFRGNYFEQHFIPLRDEMETRGALIVIHDVAHRVKIEDKLKSVNESLARKNKELRQRNEELVSFAYVAGHDLKEPLRKIYTFIEMIVSKEAGKLSDEGRALFKRVQASVQRMGMLTDDMLRYSELNSIEYETEDIDLNSTLKYVRSLLKEQVDSKHAIVEIDALPVIRGYRHLISQFFQHLLSNALKFQGKGNIPHIIVSAKKIAGNEIGHPDAIADQNYYRISITDNGIGIEPQYADRIFLMFQRLNHATAYPGTGIGLSLCRKIAGIHKGFITLESEPGTGSTFHCYFPAG